MHISPPITSFSGDAAWLSNFHPVTIKWDGDVFPSVEHAYQAAKCVLYRDVKMIRDAATPGMAKKLGRNVACQPEWYLLRVGVMQELLKLKFPRTKSVLSDLLVGTGTATLIEGNYWGDEFWGVCDGVGQNHLGQLLMRRRARLRAYRAMPPIEPED